MKKIIVVVLGVFFLLIILYAKKFADNNGHKQPENITALAALTPIPEDKSVQKTENTPTDEEVSYEWFIPVDWESCSDLPRKLITCEPFVCTNPVGPIIASLPYPIETSYIIIDGLTEDNKCKFRNAWTHEDIPGYEIFDLKCSLGKTQIEEVSKYFEKLINAPRKRLYTLDTEAIERVIPIKGNPFEKLIRDGNCIHRNWIPD